jgi:two-component system LytT family sensor kinase
VIRIFLQKKNYNWLRLAIAVIAAIVAVAWVLEYYGIPWDQALIDSLIHGILAFLGIMVLENAFGFYFPKGSFGWFRPVLTLLLTLAVLFAGKISLAYLFGSQADYLLFLDQSFWARALILIMLFGSFSVLLIFHSELEDQLKLLQRKEHIEKMAKDAELYQLRQQLQPHFLFNSLNSINALIGSNPEQAREMVLQLSEFFRGTIRKDDRKWIAISEEIEQLQLFLNIERIRFGNRLKVVFQVGDDAQSLKIPQLLIQPLLENAVKHGLNGVIDEVKIEMIMQKTGSYLEIIIVNPYDPSGGQAQGTGFGLDAVRRRLYLLFGRYDLIEVLPADLYFTVKMKIPQLYDQDDNY